MASTPLGSWRSNCAVRALWVFSAHQPEVLYSRRFPAVEKQAMRDWGPGPCPQPPDFDEGVAATLLGAAQEQGSQEGGLPPAAVCLWRSGATQLVAALLGGAARSVPEQLDDTAHAGPQPATVGYLPYLLGSVGHLCVAMLPHAPELLCPELLAEALQGRGRHKLPQDCWPDAAAASSLRITAALQLLGALAGVLSHGAAGGHHGGGGGKPREAGREAEPAIAALRRFVSVSLPMGVYSGTPPLEGDPKARTSTGGAALDSLQPAWKPQLFVGGKQRLHITVVETVRASLPSDGDGDGEEAGGGEAPPPHAHPHNLRVAGCVQVAAEMKGLPEIALPLASPELLLRGVALNHCRGTEPPLRAGATEGVAGLTLVVVPPLRRAAVAHYVPGAGCRPPFTGSYRLSYEPERTGGDGEALSALLFCVELVYAPPPSPKAVLEACAVHLPMDPTLEVVALEGAACTVGAAALQGGELTWSGLGGGRLSARTARATATGTLLCRRRPPRLAQAWRAADPAALATTSSAAAAAAESSAGEGGGAPAPSAGWLGLAGIHAQQAVARRAPAFVAFRIQGHTLSGTHVEADKVAVSPSTKDVATEVQLETVAHKGEYVLWSHPCHEP